MNPLMSEDRLTRLEFKVNVLLAVAALQVVSLLLSWIGYWFGSTFWVLLILVAIGVLLYAFRQQLPSLSGRLIRYVFSRQGPQSESDDSIV